MKTSKILFVASIALFLVFSLASIGCNDGDGGGIRDTDAIFTPDPFGDEPDAGGTDPTGDDGDKPDGNDPDGDGSDSDEDPDGPDEACEGDDCAA